MDENQPPAVPIMPYDPVSQMVGQQALLNAGMDVPRMWATMIGLADDKLNGVSTIIFRDGVRAEYQVPGADGSLVTKTQEAFRTVSTVVLPRASVREFLEGALAHFKAQDASEFK